VIPVVICKPKPDGSAFGNLFFIQTQLLDGFGFTAVDVDQRHAQNGHGR
jgi:hypothetical protein